MIDVLTDLRTALWLKSRDVFPRRRGATTLIIASYLAFTLLLGLGAVILAGETETPLDNVLLLTAPVWLLWSVVPFVGGGGGDIDATSRLAPYPVSPRIHLFSTWASAFLDLPYLIAVPLLLALSYASSGLLGVLAVLAFVLGASAVGQFGAWLSGALHRRARGESLTSTALVVVALAVLSLTPLSIQTAFSFLPPAWLITALEEAAAGRPLRSLLWTLLLLAPTLLALAALPVVRRALDVRAQGPAPRARPWGAPSRSLPVVAVLVQLMMRSSLRALSTRALLLSVLAIPFVASLTFGGVTAISYASLAAFAVFASAATIAVNAWAFEAGGVQLLLAAPVPARLLVWSRVAASALTLLLIDLVVLTAALLAAPAASFDARGSLLAATALSLLCAITGTASSTKRPAGVDFDSLRARPTTFPAATGFLAHTLLVLGVLTAAMQFSNLPAAALLLFLYAIFTVERSTRRISDGAVLTAALR